MSGRLTIEKALRAVDAYISGVARQDREALMRLFAETAHITGIDEGAMVSVPRDRWIEAVCAPQRAGAGSLDYRITSLDVAETVAVVVVRTFYGSFAYADVLTLLGEQDAVRVTGKTFHQYDATVDQTPDLLI